MMLSFKTPFHLWEDTAQFHQPCFIREDTDFHIVRRNDEANNQLIKEYGHQSNQSIFSSSILYHMQWEYVQIFQKLLFSLVERTLVRFANINTERNKTLSKVNDCQCCGQKGRMLCEIIEAQASGSLSVINFGSALRSNESIQSLHEISSLIFFSYSFLN